MSVKYLDEITVFVPSIGDDARNSSFTSPPVRRVAVHEAKSPDFISRLRESWLGKAYINYLKRYSMIRRVVRWGFRHGYPIYLKCSSLYLLSEEDRKARRWRRLEKGSIYAMRSGSGTRILANASVVHVRRPTVFPVAEQMQLSPHADRYVFPEVFRMTIDSAMVCGGTNLIIAGDAIVCHDLYDFDRDYTSEELHGRARIDPKNGRVRWLVHDKQPIVLHEAAAFVDACASNYAHWLTEVLPRICLFCSESRYADIPIVVNDNLHPNIMESLSYVVGSHREVIALPIGRTVSVRHLHVISATGYIPFDRRTDKLDNHSHGVFSPIALNALREQLSASISYRPGQEWPIKLYLRRTSGARRLTNDEEIERVLASRGYVVVEPERLTFEQQMLLFENARYVVAPTGAACANLVFCKPGTRVTIMMAKHERMPYSYWSNMAAPLGVLVDYVLGEIVDAKDRGIHGDYKVSPDNVLNAAIAMEVA